MNLPDSVKVGAATYEIKHRKMDDRYGHVVHMKARITLDTRQAETHRRDTVVHEILHVIFHQAGFAATVDGWTHESEEMMTTVLAPWLLGWIRDNPQLIEYLGGE